MAKTTESSLVPVSREAIAEVRGEDDFIEFLRRELEWPIPIQIDRLDDVAIPYDLQQDFGFAAGEDRIRVSRLLSLSEDQPWGIFLFEFKTKHPYLTHLRRLLRILGSQRTLRRGDPIWSRDDLLFVCTRDWTEFQFVHFMGEKPESAVISSFGWNGPEDPFLHTLCRHNLPRLRMPQPGVKGNYDPDDWRNIWREAFSVKPVTDEFYTTLKEVFNAVQAGVKGLKGANRRFFAELVVNRLVFLKFVEKKGWLDDDKDYLIRKFRQYGRKHYWKDFLFHLFFEGLNTDPDERSSQVNALLGKVPFINAELFAREMERWDDEKVNVDNQVFDLLFEKLLNPYNFTVCETSPLDIEVAFNQDLLGYGYEELIADQHGQGAYYTHPTEVNLMCRESLRAYLESQCSEIDKDTIGKLIYGELIEHDELANAQALELYQALHDVRIVDPALGSGTFPVAMMKHLFADMRTLGVMLKGSKAFDSLVAKNQITDPDDAYALKLHIIERSLYGCDVDYFAVQIAKLRFWIELMVECDRPRALPNFDFKLVVGDALIGVVGTDSNGKLLTLEDLLGHPTRGQMTFGQLIVEKLARLKSEYFSVRDTGKRHKLEEQIVQTRDELLRGVGAQMEKLDRTDKHVLWQIDFAEIFSGGEPGFDIAIANPPYLRQELIDSTFEEFLLLSTKKTLLHTYNQFVDNRISAKADLYVFFFYRALQLLKQERGICCYICSNSWLDVGYGSSLRNYLLQTCDILLILDSVVERWFSNAAINTTIDIFRIRNAPPKSEAYFAVTYSSLSELSSKQPFRAALSQQSSLTTREFRRLAVSRKDLAATEKWGAFYLKAPDIFHRVAEILDRCTVQLESLGTIRRGITSGCNAFFYLDKERAASLEIEEKYLRPVCRGPRDIHGCVIGSEFPFSIFVCQESKEEIKGTHALSYIQWGESKGYHRRPTVASRERWYDVGYREPSQLCVNHRVHRIMRCYFNKGAVIIGDNFHEICGLSMSAMESSFVSINSSFIQLWIQALGRVNFGDGLLEFKGYEINRIPVINPTGNMKTEISKAFHEAIKSDDIDSVTEICDKAMSKYLGEGSKFLSDVRKTSQDLIETRLAKASTGAEG